MAGLKKAGVDLDTLLEPWQSGDGFAAATGIKIASADINTKYAPASVGTGYTGGTNFKQNSADVGPRFCAKGTRVTQTVNFLGGMSVTIPNGWVGIANTTSNFSLASDGTGTRGRGPTLPAVTFNWTSDGAPPVKNYQVRVSNVVVTVPNGAWTFTNLNGGAWAALDSTHGANLYRLTFGPSSNGGQGDIEVTALIEVRDATTLAVVYSSNVTITGTAQNA